MARVYVRKGNRGAEDRNFADLVGTSTSTDSFEVFVVRHLRNERHPRSRVSSMSGIQRSWSSALSTLRPMILGAALGPLGVELCRGPEFGGVYRRKVCRMSEEHAPGIADELVEVDRTYAALGGEVRDAVTMRM